MEAIVFEEFGGPGVLGLAQAEEPHAGPGQVRVKVMAAGVNPLDYKIRYGWMEQASPTTLPRSRAWSSPGSSTRSAKM